MFCSNCRTELPDEANFCWHCGDPQKRGPSKPAYEYCRIRMPNSMRGLTKLSHYQFLVVGEGPDGKEYPVVPPSGWILCSKERQLLNAVREIVRRLELEGWENTAIVEDERSYYSYSNYHFRRKRSYR